MQDAGTWVGARVKATQADKNFSTAYGFLNVRETSEQNVSLCARFVRTEQLAAQLLCSGELHGRRSVQKLGEDDNATLKIANEDGCNGYVGYVLTAVVVVAEEGAI